MNHLIRAWSLPACLALALLIHSSLPAADAISPGPEIHFPNVTEGEDVSGITQFGKLLVICSDEGARFDVLKSDDDKDYHLLNTIPLSIDPDEELDLEGATSDGKHVYLIGSHSLARKKLDPADSYKKNRKRLAEVDDDDFSRDIVAEVTLDDNGQLLKKHEINLRKLLKHDSILSGFTDVPSKENGIDIEGIAAKDGKLYIGFRGPVLRGNYVPVMVLDFESPEAYELRFVNLHGRGIRDITAVRDGFLLIAGPIGDGDDIFQICHWNGKDAVESPKDADKKDIQILGTLQHDDGAPEGLAVFGETDDEYSVVMVYDGAKNGGPKRFTVKKNP